MTASVGSRPVTILALMALHIFLGLGGLGGGIGMLLDPSGAGMGLRLELLDSIPIDSFLLPGLILTSIFGVCPLITAYGLLARPAWGAVQRLNPWREYHWSWAWTRVIASFQVLWIGLEFLMWGLASPLQPILLGVAAGMLILSSIASVKNWLRVANVRR